MQKPTKLPPLLKSLCIVSLAFTVPAKAPASPDCCASWAIAGGIFWGGAMACGALSVCTIQGCKALSESCDNCCQSLYKWIDKKEEEKRLSQSTTLLSQVKGRLSRKDGDDKITPPLPSIIYEPKSVITPSESSLQEDLILPPLHKSPSTSSLSESEEN
ncbi:MAG: hypothetical protein B7Y25_03320 [Alphaproteobacteria bacterium 16-39-46]|nr:MAG: hypothetical protein B7Y25_03320 [Alphaproteobacteria bacterium 16-39-46]OZA43367.1 MAG: hypothetical protein B7X84_03430 [Alphaproteobacteria bacterium 17-39-52]HQS83910.1 hypothetical protein [Alphaproteobacteria bacterium]HQS93824.1 hypothetical protein [Alphaproteobacteria bacterium]